ncbi:MAG: hypothetical protein R3Y08_04780 [Rikenellaceae bacterium]
MNFQKLIIIDVSLGAKPPPHQRNKKVKNEVFGSKLKLGAARNERDKQALSSINPMQSPTPHHRNKKKSKTKFLDPSSSLVPRGMSAISRLLRIFTLSVVSTISSKEPLFQ